MADAPTRCPKCGHDNPEASEDCENCGITFDIYRMEQERISTLDGPKESAQPSDEKNRNNQLAGCPSCGHPTDLSSEDCLKCGIVFAKYFEIQERALADDADKLAKLRMQKAAYDEAVARRKKLEADERAKRQRQEQIDRQRAEALKKQKAEQAKAKEKRDQEAARERQEALKTLQEKFEQDQQKKRLQEKKSTEEALAQLKQDHEQLDAERAKRAEQEAREALERQKEDFERQQAEAVNRSQAELQEALERQKAAFAAEADARRQAAEAALKTALEQQKKDIEKNRSTELMETIRKNFPPQPRIHARLKTYDGQTVGINLHAAAVLEPAILAGIGEDHFSVVAPETGQLHSFPFSVIASVSEGTEGSEIGEGEGRQTVYVTIRVRHSF